MMRRETKQIERPWQKSWIQCTNYHRAATYTNQTCISLIYAAGTTKAQHGLLTMQWGKNEMRSHGNMMQSKISSLHWPRGSRCEYMCSSRANAKNIAMLGLQASACSFQLATGNAKNQMSWCEHNFRHHQLTHFKQSFMVRSLKQPWCYNSGWKY